MLYVRTSRISISVGRAVSLGSILLRLNSSFPLSIEYLSREAVSTRFSLNQNHLVAGCQLQPYHRAATHDAHARSNSISLVIIDVLAAALGRAAEQTTVECRTLIVGRHGAESIRAATVLWRPRIRVKSF